MARRSKKKKGYPWAFAKGADTFCPIGKFIPASAIPNPDNVNLWLKVDNLIKQNGNTKDLIFKIPQLLSYISDVMTLEPGDLVLTGTPEGVGPVNAGQVITAGLIYEGKSLSEILFPVENKPKASL